MLAEDALSVLDVLRNAGADVWIGGGWGIDALVGRQTRQHRDLDLMHRKSQEPAVVAAQPPHASSPGTIQGSAVPCLSPEQHRDR
jgi:hypothetical protein